MAKKRENTIHLVSFTDKHDCMPVLLAFSTNEKAERWLETQAEAYEEQGYTPDEDNEPGWRGYLQGLMDRGVIDFEEQTVTLDSEVE